MKHSAGKRETGRERVSRQEVRRDPAFCRDLAREWGMDAAPKAYRKALEHMYAELPDELPVKRYPLRSALRGLTVAAAAVALVCASMFGVNAVNPQLMESLPGIGQVFRAVNGTEEQPPPENPPTVVPGPEESSPPVPEPTPKPKKLGFPDFTPVVIVSETGLNGTLTVENAYSDGVCLYLGLCLDTQDAGLRHCPWVAPTLDLSGGFQGEAEPVQVNGVPVEWRRSGTSWNKYGDYVFNLDDQDRQGAYRTEWAVLLPEKLTQDGELSVTLNLTQLMGYPAVWDEAESVWNAIEGESFETACSFQGQFSVQAKTAYNREFSGGIEENGVKLLNLESSPSYFIAEMELPFLGRDSYYLLDMIDGPYRNGCYFPIGRDPILKTEDGTVLERDPQLDDGSEYLGLAPDGPLHGTWVYQGPPPGTKTLILTFYDDTMAFPFMGEDPPYSWNRVTAEFTIDLESGTIVPSENYRAEGFKKLDPAAYLQEPRHGDFTNGFYLGPAFPCGVHTAGSGTGPWENVHQVTIYAEDTAYRPVELHCYLGQELAAVLRSHPPEEFNAVEEGGPDTATYYQAENGRYWEGITDPQITQKALRVMSFQVDYPEDVPRTEDGAVEEEFHLELVDAETGEVLLEDMEKIYARQIIQMFGEEFGKAALPQTSPAPQPTPNPGESSAADLPAAPPVPEPSPQPTPMPQLRPTPRPTP